MKYQCSPEFRGQKQWVHTSPLLRSELGEDRGNRDTDGGSLRRVERQLPVDRVVRDSLPPGWNRLGISDPVPPIFRSNAENTHARPYEGVYAPPELPQAQPPPVPEMYLGPGLGRHQRLFGGPRLGVLDRVLQRALDGDLHRLFVRRQCPAPE